MQVQPVPADVDQLAGHRVSLRVHRRPTVW
jgi:hypothetical protein